MYIHDLTITINNSDYTILECCIILKVQLFFVVKWYWYGLHKMTYFGIIDRNYIFICFNPLLKGLHKYSLHICETF